MTTKRLYKSRTERMIDGVCGGLAEFFSLDVTLVRIAWVLLTLIGGSGILLYIVAMIVMPVNPAPIPVQASARSTGANAKFWGILLVVIGILWLLRNLDIPYYLHWWGFSWDYVLPVILIMAGVAFLYGGRSGMTKETEQPVQPAETGSSEPAGEPSPGEPSLDASQKAPEGATMESRPLRLCKSRLERKMFGVCGGIATYLNVDPTIIRILFVVAALASFGFMILLYIAMAIIMPNEPVNSSVNQSA